LNLVHSTAEVGLKYLAVYENPQQAVEKARKFVLELFQAKQGALLAEQKQRQNEAVFFFALGAFLLWAMSQK